MESKYVKLTLPKKLYQEGLFMVKEFGYSNLQDLTIESLRKQVIELKREQALINLRRNLGSVKFKKRMTVKQKEEIAKKHTPLRAKELTKEFELKDIEI